MTDKRLISEFLLVLFSFLIVELSFSQSVVPDWKDIDYGGTGHVSNFMDIYIPKDIEPPYPVIIGIYASAFKRNNYKGNMQFVADFFREKGFAFVAVNHRSSSDAIWPAQINDIKASVRFVRGNATQYQLDTSFIGITGFSSGGHLAAMTGTTGEVMKHTVNGVSLDIDGSVGDYIGFSSRVHAVVDWFGPIDFLIMYSTDCDSLKLQDKADSPESLLIGGILTQENKEMCALANPITYIDKEDPPFLIIHGDADPLVPWCQSQILYEALQTAGVPSEFILVPGAGHGPGLYFYKENAFEFFKREYNKVKRRNLN